MDSFCPFPASLCSLGSSSYSRLAVFQLSLCLNSSEPLPAREWDLGGGCVLLQGLESLVPGNTGIPWRDLAGVQGPEHLPGPPTCRPGCKAPGLLCGCTGISAMLVLSLSSSWLP